MVNPVMIRYAMFDCAGEEGRALRQQIGLLPPLEHALDEKRQWKGLLAGLSSTTTLPR
ncbi:hypothetical protein JS531_09030 [Bifidobacterium sp. CP2]|uniref:hypothetical protein n=2 Tax=Bifidobacterium TaxID=1678 RepID=UPI001BDD391E|nr:hypothetical protein [Bifidobacterium sp. CP2]MBT1182085.1 hypothetical protein [Bifidobacterium sp. CP2]